MRIALIFSLVLGLSASALADSAPVAPPPDTPAAESASTAPEEGDAAAPATPSTTVPDPLLEPEPLLGSPGTYDGMVATFLRTMLMLALVLGLVYLVLHKGVGELVARQRQGQRIKVVERVPLEQKRALYLVEVDGREILLAGSDHGVVQLLDVKGGAGFAGALEKNAARGRAAGQDATSGAVSTFVAPSATEGAG